MSEDKMRAEFEAWWKQTFLIEHGKWKYADMEALLFQAWQAGIASQAKSVTDGWVRAVDEELVMTCLGVANYEDDYDTAKSKLDQLIEWHIAVATDPAVNGGYSLQQADKVRELEKDAAIGKLVRSKLISCNDVPVSRCHISADEVQAIDQAMKRASN